jgi:hypothetical protein
LLILIFLIIIFEKFNLRIRMFFNQNFW